MRKLNEFPSSRQVEALRDLMEHPDNTLRERAVRLECSHVAVGALLAQCERRALVERLTGCWRLTKRGRAWLRPTMATRRAS